MAGQVILTTGGGHGYSSWLASECHLVPPKGITTPDESVILGVVLDGQVPVAPARVLNVEGVVRPDQSLNFGVVWPRATNAAPEVWIVTLMPAVPVPEFTDVTDADAWLEANA